MKVVNSLAAWSYEHYTPSSKEIEALATPQDFAAKYIPAWVRTPQHKMIGDTIDKYVKLAKATNQAYYILVSMHPRSGKSVFISGTYPAYHLTKYPSDRILLFTHSQGLAKEFSIMNRDLLEEEDLGVRVNPNRRSGDEWFTTANPPGGIKAAGVTSKILGKGFQVTILDDLFASEFESQSEAYRKRLRMIFDSSVSKRLEPGGIFLLPATRWDLSDLPQYIIDTMSAAGLEDRVVVLNFPALAEDDDLLGRKPGEALIPFRFPREKLLEIKATTPAHIWESQFQGKPQASSGSFFSEDCFKWFRQEGVYFLWRHKVTQVEKRMFKSELRFFQFWDTTMLDKDDSDFTVCATIGIIKREDKHLLFIYDILREHVQAADLLERVIKQKQRFPEVQRVFVEEASSGYFLRQTAAKLDIPVFGIKPRGKSKEERAMPLQSFYNMGNVFHCQSINFKTCEWLKDFEYELTCFRGRYNDQVDAVAYCALALQSDIDPNKKKDEPFYGLAIADYSSLDFNKMSSMPEKKDNLMGIRKRPLSDFMPRRI